jgi:small subunit ribosomal protein S5
MNKHRQKSNEVKEFGEAVIQIDRVTRVVKGGRRLRFRATVCVGNNKGKVGLGIGKSNEVVGAIQKATHKAKKNMVTVPLDGTTIPHDIRVKFKGSQLLLLPASEGTGLIAGGTVRKVLELAGVKNVLSKAYGSNNRVNVAKVTVEGLKQLRETPKMEAAKAKKLTKTVGPAVTPIVKTEAPKKATPVKKEVAQKTETKPKATLKKAPTKTTKNTKEKKD